MPRWLWFAPFAALVAVLAVWGFRMGWIRATITETDVIEAYAARYIAVAGASARVTDCSAQPGKAPAVWIIVSCERPETKRMDFPVDRMGRLLTLTPPRTSVDAPET